MFNEICLNFLLLAPQENVLLVVCCWGKVSRLNVVSTGGFMFPMLNIVKAILFLC